MSRVPLAGRSAHAVLLLGLNWLMLACNAKGAGRERLEHQLTASTGWDTAFSESGLDAPGHCFFVDGATLYVGGRFSYAKGNEAERIAMLDTRFNRWRGIRGGQLDSSQGAVSALALRSGLIHVGGSFLGGVALQDGGGWAPLSGGVKMPGFVFAMASAADGLFVGGNFITHDHSGAKLAFWNETYNRWEPFQHEPDRIVHALALSGDELFVGGNLLSISTQPLLTARAIARYTRSSKKWSALGEGLQATPPEDALVRAIAVDGDFVYVGGRFARAGGVAANNVARWRRSTQAWEALGSGPNNGVNGFVESLLVHGGKLYVGGTFGTAGGTAASNVARWDPTTRQWAPLGTGVSGGQSGGGLTEVRALAVVGNFLYLTGNFTEAGDSPARFIARWSLP